MSQLLEVKNEAVMRAVRLLNAAGCKYAIRTEDGKSFGELEVAEQRKKSGPKFGRGALLAYYGPLLKDIKPGDCKVIPYGQFSETDDAKAALRSSICSYCSRECGLQSYISHMNGDGVELLRL